MTTEAALASKWMARSCKWQAPAQEQQEEHRFPKGNALRKKQEFNVSMPWVVATTSNLVINSPYNDLAAFFTALHPLMLLPTATGWLHHCRGLETNPLRHRAGLELATQLCSMPPLGDKPPQTWGTQCHHTKLLPFLSWKQRDKMLHQQSENIAPNIANEKKINAGAASKI